MPKKLNIMVGMVKIMVRDVNTFITVFKLLEMTELYASIVTSKILEYTLAISIACLFSTIASSRSSSSSGYFLTLSKRIKRSNTSSLARRELLKYTSDLSKLNSWNSSSFLVDLCNSCSILPLERSSIRRYCR